MNAPLLVMTRQNPWEGFSEGAWRTEVNVRDFINQNYTPYVGDDSFLAGATARTKAMWETVAELIKKEQANGGVLDVSADRPSSIVAHDAGYIDRNSEIIVGLQTDAPLKRAIMPNGGLRMVESGLEAYGFKADPLVSEIWTKYRASLMSIRKKSWPAASPASSPVCRMPTGAAASSATTAVSRCTASMR